MKAIVTTRTDHTNVYGYIDVEALNENGTPAPAELLPRKVRAACQYQYPSMSHISNRALDEVARLLKRLGWTILDEDGAPYQFSTYVGQPEHIS